MPDSTAAWPMVPLGDILERVVRPVRVERDQHYQEIGIRSHCKGIFHKPPTTGKTIGSKRVFWVEPGCLVFNIIFAWEQAVALTTERERGLIASHRFPMYRSLNGALLPEFAYLYFSSPRGKHILTLASPGGAGWNKTLGQEEFKRLKIPVPPPNEQQRIVEILTTCDQSIRRMRKLIAAKRRLKQGLMQQLLTGQRRFPEFADGWKQFSFSDIASLGRDRYKPNNNTDVPCVELEHIAQVDGRLLGTTDARNQRSMKAVFRRGDVLFGKLRPNLRKFVYCTFEGVCSTEIWVLRANRKVCCSEYLFQIVQSERFVSAACRTAGSKMPRAEWSYVSHEMFRLPQISEQRRIATALDTIDREISGLSSLIECFGRQKRGLMQKLLTGEIRVKRPKGGGDGS